MLTILASFAQEESRSVSEKCKWRIRNNFKDGIPNTFQVYGYTILKDGILPQYYVSNNHDAIIDRDIFNKVKEEIQKRKEKYKEG